MSRNIATCPLGFNNMQLGCDLFHDLSTINLYFIFTIIYDFMQMSTSRSSHAIGHHPEWRIWMFRLPLIYKPTGDLPFM